MRALLIAILASTLFGCNFYIRPCATSEPQKNAQKNVGLAGHVGLSAKLVYHQGCARRYPGNSWPAIECAVKEGAPIIEIDVRPARDGELFLFHDRRINLKAHSDSACLNTVCPSIAVSDLSSGEIAKWRYRASVEPLSERDQGFGKECQKKPIISDEHSERVRVSDQIDCPKRWPDELRILRLKELLRLPLGGSKLLLDMKGDDLQIALRILEFTQKTLLQQKLIFSCGRDSLCLEELKRLTPPPRILFRAKSAADVARALPHNPEIIQIDQEWSTAELEDQIKASGAEILIKALATTLPPADYVLVDR